jgi:hypothetical protein
MRGRTIDQILAYDVPVDNVDQGTVSMPGMGTATVSAFALVPGAQGGFATFQLGVDDPSTLNIAALSNPIEIRLVVTPVRQDYEGNYSTMNYASTTMLSY